MSDEKVRPIDQTVDQITQASVETSRIQGGMGETVDSPSARGGATAQSLPVVGENLGRYKIIKLLGQGGMGAVFLAHDPTLDRKVALKIPFLNANNADEVLQRFQREARAVAALQHPNICPVHEVTVDRGIHFMVMAFIEGRPLSDYLKKAKRFKVASAINLVRKLALTLDEAHRKGVIHRDLKPANIMIDARNEPQIMDFGLARLDNIEASQLTAMGQILGTPAYMPPEQVSGNIDATGASSDIYSLGVMLYEMLTGQLPLTGDMMSLMFKIANETPAPASTHREGIPDWLDKVCAIAMAKKPKERFVSMKAFADALQGEAATREIEATLPIGAVAASAVPAASLPHLTIDTSPNRKPQVASGSGRGRNKKRNYIIAAAALPLFLLAGGWIIRITNPDGTEQTIRAAAGAKVEIQAEEEKPTRKVTKRGSGVSLSKWPDNAPPLALAPFNAGQAAQHQAAWAKYLGVPAEYTNSIGMKFRLVPPGQFTMGSSDAEGKRVIAEESNVAFTRGFQSESPRHPVTLTQPYFLAIHEVTLAQYASIMDGVDKPPTDREAFPASSISFDQAIEFCEKLSQQELLVSPDRHDSQLVTFAGNTNGYRLPTEPEWEYACRAGTESMSYAGDTPESIASVGWINVNSDSVSHSVGKLPPNHFGMYDMHGNVSEWVEDHFDPISYGPTAVYDPLPIANAGFGRLTRGGSSQNQYSSARSSARRDVPATAMFPDQGFRVVIPVEAVKMRSLYVQSPARAAATAILRAHGRVTVGTADGTEVEIEDIANLPMNDFKIFEVVLELDYPSNECLILLSGMSSVRRVYVGGGGNANPLSMHAIAGLNSLSGLKDLVFNAVSDFDDKHLDELKFLPQVEKLALWNHRATDTSLSKLNRFPNVVEIQFGNSSGYSGDGLKSLTPMPSVKKVGFSLSGFDDSAVSYLSCFPSLESLALGETKITDTGIREIAKLKKLTELEIQDCNVTPDGVNFLQDALPNCKIKTKHRVNIK